MKGLIEVRIESFLRGVDRLSVVFKEDLPRKIVGSERKGVYFVPSDVLDMTH